jgi:hypothetical protein
VNDPVSCGNRKDLHLLPLNVRSQATPGLARDQKLDASRCSLCAYKPNDPVSCGQKAHAFSAQRAFSSDPGLARGQKARFSPCASYNDPVSRTKGSRFFPQRAFFSKRPQVLHAAKKLAAHRALITQTTPFLADKRLTLFPLNVRFQATPDLARGLKPAAHRALTTTKQQINNQQQTTNATPKFLLIPRSVLLTLVTRDRTQGAVFSVTS